MRKRAKRFHSGQVIWLGYAREYRRIFRVGEFGLCVGTKRSNVYVQFTDVRPLTSREAGKRVKQ